MLKVLNKGKILCKLQRLKMLKLWTKLEMLKDLSKMCKLNTLLGVGVGQSGQFCGASQ